VSHGHGPTASSSGLSTRPIELARLDFTLPVPNPSVAHPSVDRGM
jgi:hypothetical protein